MIAAWDADDIRLLLAAMHKLRQQASDFATFAAQFTQGTAQTGALRAIGDRQLHIESVCQRLREALADRTGMPEIQHRNADIADCRSPAWPMSRAEEAQEANFRG